MALKFAAAFALSFIVTVAAGFLLIPALRRIKAGQTIREDGPVWHNKKQGTPTMGGIMFIAGITVTCLALGSGNMRRGDFSHIYMLLFALIYAVIGFFDDYIKLRKKQNLGLKAKHKFALQLIPAVLFLILMCITGKLIPVLYIPFVNMSIMLPVWIYYIFAVFVCVGTVNAVNVTDGVDGLATGAAIPSAVCLTALSVIWNLTAFGIFAAALTGGLAAFLIFNFHPAKVFMGDTGAHFLGGALCAMALTINRPLILIPLGMMFILETLSDIIQVVYFRATHGKRVFKMAPLHHHLEMCGWSEYRPFTVFTVVSGVFAVITYFRVRRG